MSLTRKDQTLKVLIVEDEVTIARNLFSIVSQYATVKMVHTYEDAVAILPDYKPSLILLDVNLEAVLKMELILRRNTKKNTNSKLFLSQPILMA
ncbi:response regulator [Tenacibaculum sp. SG-28]|uniref:response regulator n=1 Tax=Tenacibaculum sp. SG-28 TaxID=754426 RepID=UPI000CF43C60|nr:response regulator [Tenacibaculum sp. SG-28]PQJ22785.1 hypothetical protein BSU00_00220 [Tenacibaculum sp. SG-28]